MGLVRRSLSLHAPSLTHSFLQVLSVPLRSLRLRFSERAKRFRQLRQIDQTVQTSRTADGRFPFAVA